MHQDVGPVLAQDDQAAPAADPAMLDRDERALYHGIVNSVLRGYYTGGANSELPLLLCEPHKEFMQVYNLEASLPEECCACAAERSMGYDVLQGMQLVAMNSKQRVTRLTFDGTPHHVPVANQSKEWRRHKDHMWKQAMLPSIRCAAEMAQMFIHPIKVGIFSRLFYDPPTKIGVAATYMEILSNLRNNSSEVPEHLFRNAMPQVALYYAVALMRAHPHVASNVLRALLKRKSVSFGDSPVSLAVDVLRETYGSVGQESHGNCVSMAAVQRSLMRDLPQDTVDILARECYKTSVLFGAPRTPEQLKKVLKHTGTTVTPKQWAWFFSGALASNDELPFSSIPTPTSMDRNYVSPLWVSTRAAAMEYMRIYKKHLPTPKKESTGTLFLKHGMFLLDMSTEDAVSCALTMHSVDMRTAAENGSFNVSALLDGVGGSSMSNYTKRAVVVTLLRASALRRAKPIAREFSQSNAKILHYSGILRSIVPAVARPAVFIDVMAINGVVDGFAYCLGKVLDEMDDAVQLETKTPLASAQYIVKCLNGAFDVRDTHGVGQSGGTEERVLAMRLAWLKLARVIVDSGAWRAILEVVKNTEVHESLVSTAMLNDISNRTWPTYLHTVLAKMMQTFPEVKDAVMKDRGDRRVKAMVSHIRFPEGEAQQATRVPGEYEYNPQRSSRLAPARAMPQFPIIDYSDYASVEQAKSAYNEAESNIQGALQLYNSLSSSAAASGGGSSAAMDDEQQVMQGRNGSESDRPPRRVFPRPAATVPATSRPESATKSARRLFSGADAAAASRVDKSPRRVFPHPAASSTAAVRQDGAKSPRRVFKRPAASARAAEAPLTNNSCRCKHCMVLKRGLRKDDCSCDYCRYMPHAEMGDDCRCAHCQYISSRTRADSEWECDCGHCENHESSRGGAAYGGDDSEIEIVSGGAAYDGNDSEIEIL